MSGVRHSFRHRFAAKLLGLADRKYQCAKPGCKAWSERKRRGPSRVGHTAPFSIYCNNHGCRYIDPHSGTLCLNVKSRRAWWCRAHANCEAKHCHKPRKDGKVENKWCRESHGCQAAGCGQARKPRDSQSSTKYGHCHDHNCIEKTCGKEKQKGSDWCDDHTCANPQCKAHVDPPNPRKIETNDILCTIHKLCETGGCSSPIHRLANQVLKKHCSSHYCEFDDNCTKPSPGRPIKACPNHQCRILGCGNKIHGDGAVVCDDHECKNKSCKSQRHMKKPGHFADWCELHLCREWVKECTSEGQPGKQMYCEVHEPCEEAGCSKQRSQDQGKVRPKCADHLKPPCESVGCPNRAEAGSAYCKDHVCQASRACRDGRFSVSPFCMNHKCAVSVCFEPRMLSSNPTMAFFYNAADDKGLGSYHYRLYCARHGCKVPTCDLQAVRDSRFCSRHKCKEKGCDAELRDDHDDDVDGLCHRHRKKRRLKDKKKQEKRKQLLHPGWGGFGAGPFAMDIDPQDEGNFGLRW